MKNAAYCILFAILAASCASPQYGNSVQSIQMVKSSASWDGQQLPAYTTGAPEITILRIIIPPNHTLPMHKHPIIKV